MIDGMPTENNNRKSNTSISIDTDRLIAWLNEKWSDQACPICGNSKWNVDDCIYRLHQFDFPNFKELEGRMRLVAPVTCKNCGYMLLFDALYSGVLTALDPHDEEASNE